MGLKVGEGEAIKHKGGGGIRNSPMYTSTSAGLSYSPKCKL